MNKEFTPSEKSPEMEDLLESLFGRTSSIKSGICVSCSKEVTEFRDGLSEKEYTISGLCQICQDEVFGI
jgi:hypothetical protein